MQRSLRRYNNLIQTYTLTHSLTLNRTVIFILTFTLSPIHRTANLILIQLLTLTITVHVLSYRRMERQVKTQTGRTIN